MPTSRRAIAIAIITTLAATAVTASLTVARANAPLDPPNEITLPPLYGSDVPRITAVVGDSEGVAWSVGGFVDSPATTYYSAYGGVQHVDAGAGSDGEISLAGTQLVISSSSGGPNHGVDIASGNSLPTPQPNNFNVPVASIGDGSVLPVPVEFGPGAGTYTIDRYDSSAHVAAVYSGISVDGTTSDLDRIYIPAADSAGAVIDVAATRGTDQVNRTVYLDFGTGDYTTLGSYQATQVSMDADDIVWVHGKKALYVPRDDLTATPLLATPDTDVIRVAVNDGNIAYTNAAASAFNPDVKVGALGGSTFTTVTDLPQRAIGPVVPANNGDFGVMAGTTTADLGVYRIAPGSPKLTGIIALFGPDAPLGIDASAGRILSVVARAKTHPVDQTGVSAGAQTATASRGKQLIAKSIPAVTPDSSGGNTAYLTFDGTNAYVVVLNDGKEVARVDVPDLTGAVQISGGLLLIRYRQVADQPSTEIDQIIDIASGDRQTVPAYGALYGDTVTYVGTGGIHQYNVDSKTDHLIPDSSSCTGDYNISVVLDAAGNWVFCDDTTSAGASTAYNVVTGDVVTVPTTASLNNLGSGSDDALAANGVVAWIDAGDATVHLYDLATRTEQVIGTAHKEEPAHQYLALNDDFVAWVANDDTTRVVPLGAASPAAPRYVGAIAKAAYSNRLAGAAGKYRPQLDTDRPLSRWTLSITHRGHQIATLHGKAPMGNVRPSWNGKLSNGKRAKDGTYQWALTGSGRTGSLRNLAGKAKPVTGSVRLDTVAPRARIVVHHSRHGQGHRTIPMVLSCSGGPCTFQVRFQFRSAGSTHWSKLRPWRSSTPGGRVSFGANGRPVVKRGRAYRFVVRAIDRAGNRSSAQLSKKVAG